MVQAITLVGIGGAIGSVFRFIISFYFMRWWALSFPIHTLFVNVLGCLGIGILYQYLSVRPEDVLIKYGLIVGFCGGFTTFSALSLECFQMIVQQQWFYLIVYVLLSSVTGIFAVWLGMKIG